MRKKGVLLVVALAAILGVCACGTKQKKEAVFPGLIIGGTSYTPYFYQDINGNYSGIDVDVAKEACKRAGYTPVFQMIPIEDRFVELEKDILLPLTIFIKQVLLGTCTGISFVDSTPLRVCRNQRILVHKTFEGLATRGKCSMGWFFGFKLHLVINDKGEILNFMFSPANVDDREPLKQGNFQRDIKGKLCADKGYIGQALFENLFLNGIQLLTRVKNNMRNSLMSVEDKILLRKRALIETVNDELKNIAQIEHSRHRSFNNFIANALSAIAAYCFFEKKPAIDVNFVKDRQLVLF